MSLDGTHQDDPSPLTDPALTGALAEGIADALMIVEWLGSTALTFFGDYDIQEKDSARTITLPNEADGFADAKRVYHFEPARDDHHVLVAAPACGAGPADLVASEQMDLIDLYNIHEKESARRITIPQCLQAFDDADKVYQFQMPERHQSLLIVPAEGAA